LTSTPQSDPGGIKRLRGFSARSIGAWQGHSERGALAGNIKKKLNQPLTSEKIDGFGGYGGFQRFIRLPNTDMVYMEEQAAGVFPGFWTRYCHDSLTPPPAPRATSILGRDGEFFTSRRGGRGGSVELPPPRTLLHSGPFRG
jgi:hypothetical protein